jgi:hypothetical protein
MSDWTWTVFFSQIKMFRLILSVALLFLAHSGYSAWERSINLHSNPPDHTFLKTIGKKESIPFDILIETLVAGFLCILSIPFVSGSLKPVLMGREKRSMDELDAKSIEFQNRNNRTKFLF